MPAEYPGTIPSIGSGKTDATVTTTDHPAHHNKLAIEVEAIATELGTDPSGATATVKARLDALDAADAAVLSPSTTLYVDPVNGNDGNSGRRMGAAKLTIAAAIAAGGRNILLLPGTFDVTTEQFWWFSGLHVQSLEPRKAIIRATASMGGGWTPMIHVYSATPGSPIQDVEIDGVVFNANSQTTTPILRVAGVKNFRAHDCVFKGTPSNFGIGCVTVIGGSTSGVTAIPSEQVFFEGCEFGPSGDCGVSLMGGSGSFDDVISLSDVKFDDCYVHDNDNSGISNYGYVKRWIADVEVVGCRFRRNALTQAAIGDTGHVADTIRAGWVDLEVHGCDFREGSISCGGVSDHAGRGTKIHHNHFELGAVTGGWDDWAIALGEDRTLAVTNRTWHAEIHHNTFIDCGAWDFDSCRYVRVHHNTFFRCKGRPLGPFGHHYYTRIEDNKFIECGLEPTTVNTWEQAGVSCGRGIEFRRNQFIDSQTVRATLTTALAGLNNDLKFTAWDGGTGGNSITVAYVVAGTSTPLTVTRSGTAITVNVATSGAGAATSTAAQVMAAINASDAHALLYANLATGNDGTGVVTALTATALAGGSSTAAPTMLYGVVENAGDPDEGQPPILYDDNDFTNVGTPVSRQTSYPHVIRNNRGSASISVASAGTVTLPVHADTFTITGTTNITSITADRDRQVTLRFSGALTVVDGSNLNLNGDMITSAGDLLILSCSDGTTWDEVTRVQVQPGLRLPVRVVSTSNITISPGGTTLTVDGVALANGDRILLAFQTTASQNGIYVVGGVGTSVTLTRSIDADTAVKLTATLHVQVDEGTVNKDSVWMLTTNKPITLGTTSLRFTRNIPSSPWPTQNRFAIGSTATAQPVIAENMPRQFATAAVAQTAITAIDSFHGGMIVPAGRTVTNINAFCVAAGAGAVTLFWLAIIDAYSRATLQRTANSTTLPTANLPHTRALQATWTPDVDTPVIIALATQVATTSPSFAGTPPGQAALQFQAPYLSGNSATTPTATPPTLATVLAAPAAGNVSHIYFWLT